MLQLLSLLVTELTGFCMSLTAAAPAPAGIKPRVWFVPNSSESAFCVYSLLKWSRLFTFTTMFTLLTSFTHKPLNSTFKLLISVSPDPALTTFAWQQGWCHPYSWFKVHVKVSCVQSIGVTSLRLPEVELPMVCPVLLPICSFPFLTPLVDLLLALSFTYFL